MKTFLLAAAGVALAASAAPAFAQDSAPTASIDGTSFTGPRAEIFGGWDRVGAREHFRDGAVDTVTHTHQNAGTVGMLLGYDMPIGSRLTAGVFGSFALPTAKACDYAGGTGNFGGCLRTDREIEGGARIGFKVNPRALVYAKAAYVNGRFDAKFGNGAEYGEGHADRNGGRLGVGAEYALNPHFYLKTEYDYTRFSKFHADDLGVADTSLRFDGNQVLGGFGVRF